MTKTDEESLRRELEAAARSLSDSPRDRESRARFERWMAAAGSRALPLVQAFGRESPYGTVAHAYALGARGLAGKALSFARALPPSCIWAWAHDWLREDAVLRAAPSGNVLQVLQDMVFSQPEPPTPLDAEQKATLVDALALVDRFEKVAGARAGTSDQAMALRLAALAKLGRGDEALDIARSVYERTPAAQAAISVANVHRRCGDVAAARGWFEKALGHDPGNLAIRLDLGDIDLEAGRLEQALRWYDEVLARAPEHGWARPSAAFCRFKLTGAEQWEELLETLAAPPTHDDEDHEHGEECTCGLGPMLESLAGDPLAQQRRRARQLLDRLGT